LGAILVGGISEVPPDTRPIGVFFNADASGACFAQNIHVFNPIPHDHAKVPSHRDMFSAESGSIKTTDRRTLRHHDPMWVKRHPLGEDD
jgi:hypothetical protein